ncbi:MAG TPA: phosphoenolpyruvate--protein phosphotransferase [Patescibacteria group bacterium]|nr:phosphoenolpyruvate--protein phosphotransferase [Patescibacteria group bacterium]
MNDGDSDSGTMALFLSAPAEGLFLKDVAVKESRFKGIPASGGISIAQAVILQNEPHGIATQCVPQEQIPDEQIRYARAFKHALKELEATIELANEEAPSAVEILETYRFILTDPTLTTAIQTLINECYPADFAVVQEFDSRKKLFGHAADLHLRDRAGELDHVKELLLSQLTERRYTHSMAKGSIVIATTISPTDLIYFNESEIEGFVTEVGGIASHSSILMRSLKIPAVIGVKGITSMLSEGTTIIVDGYAGEIIINPRPRTLVKYRKRQQQTEEHKKRLGKLAKLPSETRDGRTIRLTANIDCPEDAERAVLCGAEGIGLVRTEYLTMQHGGFPDEEIQCDWYTKISERAYPHAVTLRVFDIGSDKQVDGFLKESNPALGLRGIRFLLKNRDIFKTQIRAILRASLHKNICLMLPMITGVGELKDALAIIDECKRALKAEGIPFDAATPIGIMIETPAAALMAPELAAMVDFFSIGTNDLTQHALATDRTNEHVADVYDSFHPAVLRLLKTTIDAAKKRKIPVSICGEIAGHSAATELLIGLGVDELSVAPPLLLELKKRVRKANFDNAKKLARVVSRLATASDVRRKIATVRRG